MTIFFYLTKFWFDPRVPQGYPIGHQICLGMTKRWCLSSLKYMQQLLYVNNFGLNLRVLGDKIPPLKIRFWQFKWVFQYNISHLGFQSSGFYAEILILAKYPNFRGAHPLILTPLEISQNGSFTNNQTIFFQFLISKSFLSLWMFIICK